MPASSPPTTKAIDAKLARIGQRIRSHRKALKVSATTTAEAAGMSRKTLQRIEAGEPSVTMAAYLSALVAIGLDLDVVDPKRVKRGAVPRRIRIADYAQLLRISWQLEPSTMLTPKEALALYERNWRHVDRDAMSDDELSLVRALAEAFGSTLRV